MKKLIIFTMAALIGLAGPALAQQSQSGQKMQGKGMAQDQGGQSMMQKGQQDSSEPRQTQQNLERVQGQIKSMRTVNLTEVNKQHVLAKIQTQDGRMARVDLGPKDQISRMKLQKGDQVTIFGNRGNIDDHQVMMAQRIQSDGQTVNITRSQDLDLRRFNARVLGTNTASFKQFSAPPQFFTRVRLDTGQNTTVMMGPLSNYQGIDIKKGDDISLLARPANIQGKLALVAEQVKVNGKVVDVDWSRAQRQAQVQQSGQQSETQGQQQGRQSQAQEQQTARGRSAAIVEKTLVVPRYTTNEYLGKTVWNGQGEELGEISDLVFDPRTGRITYAVIEYGGLLDIGDRQTAVPWKALHVKGSNIFLNVDKQTFTKAPSFERGRYPQFEDPDWGNAIHSYYGEKPYWEDRQGQ